ncbi:hypothetical protein [Salipiger bermudensis]|uniref:hypothetical protein n=1 Tax=Salipiger bermudensis TaxID=344736 RepID=UPI001CD64D93|nr:hypothetical protein [Salipiger bermudensis]MCA1288626.1 hypothetical protein [Salipiger bermudensis]
MRTKDAVTMYPLTGVLDVAKVKPAAFNQHLYKGVLGPALEGAGEMSLASHVSQPMRGTGVVRGGGRFVTLEGALVLGVFFRLVSGGIPSPQALRMAWTFLFLGETGNGIRALVPDTPRPAGKLFPGPGDTFLLAISGSPSETWGDGDGFAFVPGSDLTADKIMEWLDLHSEDSAALCLVNLSELVKGLKSGLDGLAPLALEVDYLPGTPAQGWPDAQSDPVAAFLSEYTTRDPWGRTPARDFYSAFSAWYAAWTGAPIVQGKDGGKGTNTALSDALDALGVRKMKSNGIMTFAGIRWSDTQTAKSFLSGVLDLE